MHDLKLATNHLSEYVGRFAPSPSGPLHFGSLVAALGSYLQARKLNGKWLLRIEDIDPPREVFGASAKIIETLRHHHLFWDDVVVFQSQRSSLYENKINELIAKDLTYYCHCSRAQLSELATKTLCDCAFKQMSKKNASVRFKNNNATSTFFDLVQQHVSATTNQSESQFTIKRKDGLFAYQLAVVVDDIAQGVTQVVRGADLLHATFYQLALYQAFAVVPPSFAHLPVVLGSNGSKLSKQNHAQEIDNRQAQQNLFDALNFFDMQPPQWLKKSTVGTIIDWAIDAWDIAKLPHKIACHDNRIQVL